MRFAAGIFGAAVVFAAGCLLDTTGIGEATESTGGSSGGGSTTTVLTTSGTTSTATSTTTSTATASSSSGDGMTGSNATALLAFDSGSTQDVGAVDITDSTSTSLRVNNEGAGTATDIAAELTAEVAFTGGVYPGTGGDCGDSLPPDGSCTLEVEFVPGGFGAFETLLVLNYDDGQGPASVQLQLTATAVGSVSGLLVNPGGEMQGMPPPGWTVVEGGWQTTSFFALSGARSIHAGDVNNIAGIYRLRQSVDLSAHAAAIGEPGGVQVHLVGHARSLNVGDDLYSVGLRMVDDAGALLSEQVGPDDSGPSWTQLDLIEATVPGTRAVEVELRCQRINGDFCSAFFDDLDLTLTYPPNG